MLLGGRYGTVNSGKANEIRYAASEPTRISAPKDAASPMSSKLRPIPVSGTHRFIAIRPNGRLAANAAAPMASRNMPTTASNADVAKAAPISTDTANSAPMTINSQRRFRVGCSPTIAAGSAPNSSGMPDETLPVAMTTTPGMASAHPNAASRHFHVRFPAAMGHLLGIGPVGKSPAGRLIVGRHH